MPRKDFEAVKVMEQVGAMYGWAVRRANYTGSFEELLTDQYEHKSCTAGCLLQFVFWGPFSYMSCV